MSAALAPVEARIAAKPRPPPMVRPWQEQVPPPPPTSVTQRIEFPSEDEETGEVHFYELQFVQSFIMSVYSLFASEPVF
jgi:hypothetical protein